MASPSTQNKDQLHKKIKEIFEGIQPVSSKCSIFKVPIQLRSENTEAYEPYMLSIGPYHRGKDRLQAMEVHKKLYLKSFYERTKKVAEYIDALRKLENKARESYAEPVDLDSDKFVEMMLLDGCFIIELLRKNSTRDLIDDNDIIFKHPWILCSLQRDMLLLENQLPFFILSELYSVTIAADEKKTSIEEIIWNFVKSMLPDSQFSEVSEDQKHLLGFIHKSLVHSHIKEKSNEQVTSDDDWRHIRCATELQEAGIQFKKSMKHSLFEIAFSNGVLEIPRIIIEKRTESFLRNLIAHEQCSLDDIPIYAFDYVIVMDRLINSDKDVELLRRQGIINNTLGNDEVVAKMFNRICNFVVIGGSFRYSQLFKDVNKHCAKRWNYWKAKLRHDYFNSPWPLISILAAAIFLTVSGEKNRDIKEKEVASN